MKPWKWAQLIALQPVIPLIHCVGCRFDLIFNTVSSNLDVDAYLSLLRVDGTLVNVGLPNESDKYNVFSLVMGRRSIAGSLIGRIRETQEILDFAAQHGIAPKKLR